MFKCLKDAIDNENDDDTTNAVENFCIALAHFAIFAVNNETMVPQLKEEIQIHIKSCQNHLEKINLTQKGKKKPPGTGKSSIAQAEFFFRISWRYIIKVYWRIGGTATRSMLWHPKELSWITAAERKHILGITDGVFFMSSTNCPQHLDSALIRRFDKLIYVPLPEEGARMETFKKRLSDIKSDELSDDKLKSLAAKTATFSPCDIEKICTNAKNLTLTRLLQKNPIEKCGNDSKGEDCECCTPILLYDDVLEAVREANPTVDPKEVAELEKFAEEKGHGKVHYKRDLPKPRTFVGTIVDFFAEFFA
ncbi:Vacuolar protein sorting-associated protein 4 [Pseudolycoriella hygida]|uniref:Vacuolar protein sorting-associated protein 4 n=1 Tax=Pseudolycoriella hygida TaxID=35572 RepID=A0A9Q0MY30_9DIPT|nr:Vacuolar protein sorting-associated protein 4 [Pseudolycoriella hygida]